MHRLREMFGAAARTAVVGAGAGLLVQAAFGVGVVLDVIPLDSAPFGPADPSLRAGVAYLLATLLRLPAGALLVVVGLLIPGRGFPTVPPVRIRDGQRRSFAAACGLVAAGPFLGLLGFVRFGMPPGGGLATAVVSPLVLGVLLASQNVEPADG